MAVHNRISKYVVELKESIEKKDLENKILEAQEKLKEMDSDNDLLNLDVINNPSYTNNKNDFKGLKNYLIDLEDEYDKKSLYANILFI